MVLAAVPGAAVLVVWEIGAAATRARYGVPGPSHVVVTLAEMVADGSLVRHVLASLERILAGFAIGSGLGFVIGLVLGSFPGLRRFCNPYIQFLRYVPPISLISFAVILFGIGEASKIFLIVFTATFMVLLNTAAGVHGIPLNRLRAARSFGTRGVRLLVYVIVPSALSHVMTGMRIGMGSAFATIVVAEMLAARSGIGFLIHNAYQYLDIDKILIGIFTLGLLGYLADSVMRWLERGLARFRPLGF
jgi:NitT/TauT family transport system permease protein